MLDKFSITRWHKASAYSDVWSSRVVQMAAMILPETSTLVDFGCGTRSLKQLLPEGVRYIGVDITSNFGADHIVNLNGAYSCGDLPDGDTAFLSGVLEYIANPDYLIQSLHSKYEFILCSYCAVDNIDSKLQSQLSRRNLRWINDFTVSEIISLFEKYSYRLIHLDVYQGGNNMRYQPLFLFKKAKHDLLYHCNKAFERGKQFDLTGIYYGEASCGAHLATSTSPYYYFLAGWANLVGAKSIIEIGTHRCRIRTLYVARYACRGKTPDCYRRCHGSMSGTYCRHT